MIGLTGSPRVNGVLYGDQSEVSGRTVDESTVSVRRGGVEVIIEERYRLEGEAVWTVDEPTALVLLSDLGSVCDLALRTYAAGDPAWAQEMTVRARGTSDVPTTAPLGETDAVTGRPLLAVRYRWRSVGTYTLLDLGLGPVGGYRLVSDDGDNVVIEPYGQAVHRAETYDVGYRSARGTRNSLVLGPDLASATRIQPGTEPDTIILQTKP